MDKSEEKRSLRKALIEERLNLPDRLERADLLQRVMRIWLVGRTDAMIGAYWPIKGEFDPLPALHRWKEDGELLDEPALRRIGLPVVDKLHKTLTFHAWYPGCPMEEDAYGIPSPRTPRSLFRPCCLCLALATVLAATAWGMAGGFMTGLWRLCSRVRLLLVWGLPTGFCRSWSLRRMTCRWMRS
jgi:5-formyltetrahydrofolate cyclo-ligase